MNRLANEKSPYLLQHKNNPVDWYPWGDEAFEKAKTEDKPVFLSIGYATCHWCHVMEHESFEDETVAHLMNDAFVNIKVDREERPDIDHTYMTVCQMLTGHGGWPLTIVMTPDKEPFYAATYLPKYSRSNRIGMMEFVPAIKKAWATDRENIMASVGRIKEGFGKTLELGKSEADLRESVIGDARDSLAARFDRADGGFGSAPKFPSPHNLLFLLKRARKTESKQDLEMARLTLEKMRLGGLWDHVGFGFHRYSTDAKWLLPHFEKMLYDQAMLLLAYSEGWAATGDPLFKQTAYEIVNYLEECLTSPEGAFYSAEDADSEGEEGKFYVWTEKEILEILSPEGADYFLSAYNFKPEGNFRDEATHELTGKNIPHLNKPIPESDAANTEALLTKLRKEREKRIRPLLDDKILTDWNGLMVAALARAGGIFNDEELTQKAERAWNVIEKHCYSEGTLLHRLKDGSAEITGMADDYAFSIWGLTELYSTTLNPHYLLTAVTLQNTFNKEFLDSEHGGYFFTAHNAEKLLGRQKEIYDGAIPSSNSVAALNGIRLSRLTSNAAFEETSRKIFATFSTQIEDSPAGYTFAMLAYDLYQGESTEFVITAPEQNSEVKDLIATCRELSTPNSVLLLKTTTYSESLDRIAPFLNKYPIDHKPAVYVCRNFECRAPVFSVESLRELFTNA